MDATRHTWTLEHRVDGVFGTYSLWSRKYGTIAKLELWRPGFPKPQIVWWTKALTLYDWLKRR